MCWNYFSGAIVSYVENLKVHPHINSLQKMSKTFSLILIKIHSTFKLQNSLSVYRAN